MAVEDFDVVDGADPLPDVRLQQPPAQQVQLDCRGAAEFAPLLSSWPASRMDTRDRSPSMPGNSRASSSWLPARKISSSAGAAVLLDRCDGLETSHTHIVQRNCRQIRPQDTQLLEFLVRAPLHQQRDEVPHPAALELRIRVPHDGGDVVHRKS
jgi:hypothetical protein